MALETRGNRSLAAVRPRDPEMSLRRRMVRGGGIPSSRPRIKLALMEAEEEAIKEGEKAKATKAAAAATDRLQATVGGGPVEETRPTPPRRFFWFWRLFASSTDCPGRVFDGSNPQDVRDFLRLDEKRIRAMMPGHFEELAICRQIAMDCLRHYNSMHPGDEYEPAPGRLAQQVAFAASTCWTHGNFVARRKRCGRFSFLPAPRTLFFFELAFKGGSNEVVTCTPLDEPVTEAYSVLGFPLWWSTRRSGMFDCICKTCSRRLDLGSTKLNRTLACGHEEAERVCKMCTFRSEVLHPPPGDFVFAYDPVIRG